MQPYAKREGTRDNGCAFWSAVTEDRDVGLVCGTQPVNHGDTGEFVPCCGAPACYFAARISTGYD